MMWKCTGKQGSGEATKEEKKIIKFTEHHRFLIMNTQFKKQTCNSNRLGEAQLEDQGVLTTSWPVENLQ